jgi:hypothetical protein
MKSILIVLIVISISISVINILSVSLESGATSGALKGTWIDNGRDIICGDIGDDCDLPTRPNG